MRPPQVNLTPLSSHTPVLYSVVVRPERWNGPLDELARELAPALDMRPDAVSRMLSRGPMTAEADLTRGQAERLARSMASHGIPAEVVDHAGAVSLTPQTAPRSHSTGDSGVPSVDLFDDMEPFVEVDAPLDADFDLTSELDISPALMDFDASPAPNPSPATPAAPASSAPDTGGAWGALFPDLSPGEDRPEAATPEVAHPQPVRSPPVVDLGADDFDAPDFGATNVASSPVMPAPLSREVTAVGASPPSQIASTGIPGAPRFETGRAAAVPKREPVNADPSPVSTPRGRDHVDAADLARALGDSGQAPPFAPSGYDDRVPHSAEFALALAILAPGAGQVYNGEDDKGSSTLFWFFLIVPWFKSIKQTRERASKIATYWAPWPEPGSFKRAARHALFFYVAVISLGTFASWTMGKISERRARQELAAHIELVDRTASLAHVRTTTALTLAIEDMTEVEAELDSKRLTDPERAAALYARSLSMCESFMFVDCAEAMRRVNELSPGYKGAARLQAWANFRIAGADVAYPLLEPGSKKPDADAGADASAEAIADSPDAAITGDAGAGDAGAPLEVEP